MIMLWQLPKVVLLSVWEVKFSEKGFTNVQKLW
jgi:hypothetical protein